jgi:hypothetical protein
VEGTKKQLVSLGGLETQDLLSGKLSAHVAHAGLIVFWRAMNLFEVSLRS